jgi:hypothetical protein
MHTTLTMFDSTNPSAVPDSAKACAGYVDGNWPSYWPLIARHWPAEPFILPIAVDPRHRGLILDIEKGDATPRSAVDWLRMMAARGLHRPCLYTSVSNVPALAEVLRVHGIRRGDYRLWTAHYTGIPHICGPECGLGSIERPGMTQYGQRATLTGICDVSRTTHGWIRAAASAWARYASKQLSHAILDPRSATE